MTGVLALYRVIAFLLWFGVMFAICTVIIAVALMFVVGAVVMGLVTPSRTVGGQLRSLYANTEAGIAHVEALRG
jgi:hypothetical protein